MITKIYHWHAHYKTTDGYSHFRQLQANDKDSAIAEVEALPNFKKLYEVYRRSEK